VKQQSELVRDLTEPGWREREAEMERKFKEAIAPRQKTTPCGECHLQPGERCDVCGASYGA
jgi:hypothetical protein